jgi:ribosomal small subunit protein bTHX
MGKGDKKTAKGKRVIGSYGNVRKRKTSKTIVASKPSAKAEVVAEKKAVKKPAEKKAAEPKATKKTTKTPKAEA